MLKLIILIVCPALFSQKTSKDFSVAAELLQIFTNEELKLKVAVKNLSGKTVTVLKYRRQDYKQEKIKAAGNYVIEIQKFENNQYNLFTPSADIGAAFENQEHIWLQKGGSITDTLYIDGLSYSRSNESERGFPKGMYRLRIYFNQSMWNCNEKNGSDWIEFKIE